MVKECLSRKVVKTKEGEVPARYAVVDNARLQLLPVAWSGHTGEKFEGTSVLKLTF